MHWQQETSKRQLGLLNAQMVKMLPKITTTVDAEPEEPMTSEVYTSPDLKVEPRAKDHLLQLDCGSKEVEDHSHDSGGGRSDQDKWKWVVVGGVFVSSFLFGLERTMSLYFVELMNYFEIESSSVMSLIGTIFYVFFCFTGIFVSPISDRYGPRIVTIVGGLLVFVGLLTSAFAPNVYAYVVTFGVFLGAGFAMSFLTMTTVSVYYFQENSALAQGIGICGVGVGGVVMPILVNYLNSTYTWRGGLLIVAGMTLNMCVCGALLRPIPNMKTISPCNEKFTRQAGNGSTKKRDNNILLTFFQSLKAVMCIRSYVLLCFQMIFVQASTSILNVHAIAAVESLSGAGDGTVVPCIMSFYSATLLVGILSTSLIVHIWSVEPLIVMQVQHLIGGIGMAMVPVFPVVPVMTLFICIQAYGIGPTLNLLPLVLCKFVGQNNVRFSYAVGFIFCGIGGSVGPLLAGVLYDFTKNYANSMYLGGVGFALSVLLMVGPCITAIQSGQRGKDIILDDEMKTFKT